MHLLLVCALFFMVAVWLMVHVITRRRLGVLERDLPDAYEAAAQQSAIGTNLLPGMAQKNCLMPLSVDLMRKENKVVPFDALTTQERRVVLHANAVETMPSWMMRYVCFFLRGDEKHLIGQLRRIKTSNPTTPQMHFGAIRAKQQLQSTREA